MITLVYVFGGDCSMQLNLRFQARLREEQKIASSEIHRQFFIEFVLQPATNE